MDNRREFLKKAGILAGSMGMFQFLPKSIEAALAINPGDGSTYLDAEHIVLLMQENRSFDHSFGTLRGVRGFNDRRAITLENGNPVWLQSNVKGQTYAPFRLDIKNSKASWSSYLPHSWENQIGAWNNGKFDKWLDWKTSGYKEFKDIPLTLGYYTRADIPFYYAFADAFTICDQHFCASITGTTTNRHYFWTGKCTPDHNSKPLVRNSDVYFGKPANWKTFPERLQEQGISWKVYQNEISLQNEISGNNENFLGNFTDNNLEWFEQYNVRYKKSHIDHYQKRISELPDEIADMQKEYDLKKDQKLQKSLEQKKNQLEAYKQEVGQYSFGNFSKLSDFEQELHKRAFQTNEGDPDYHAVEEIDFEGQKITVPKGDVLYQFRKDVEDGNLPTISWLCAPQVFSDHPSAPMYGAWYISEVLNILTARPEVWKKTIFVLNYDENDGYFDHIPPFVAPNVNDNRSGDVSDDLKEDLHTEFVTRAQELESGQSERNATEGPVGLGYRVPLIVASPWTRGGWVNSEVFDITSTIKFIETFINRKYGKDVFESNISKWRRAVSGDLTSVFRPYDARDTSGFTSFVDMKRQIAEINNAKNKPAPDGYYAFTQEDINQIIKDGDHIKLPKQEKGVKPSNALRYELYVDEKTTEDGQFTLHFTASKERFGEKSLAGVFNVYANNYKREKNNWSFAMSAGKEVDYHWRLQDFDNHGFKIVVHGPNGYYRYYAGGQDGNPVYIKQFYDFQRDEVVFQIKNSGNRDVQLMSYNSYTQKKDLILVKAGKIKVLKITTKSFYNWYDIEFSAVQSVFKRRYAGRLENGRHTMSDPLMGDG